MTRTPQNLIDALQSELKEKSFSHISEATQIGTASLHSYSKGNGEPSNHNMHKLAEYFGVDVEYLRGEGIYTSLNGEKRLEVAKRLHKDDKEKAIFEMFVTERMAQIASGDTRSNKAHVAYIRRMEELKAEQQVERENLFQALDDAFQLIPVELRKEAVLWLSEKI